LLVIRLRFVGVGDVGFGLGEVGCADAASFIDGVRFSVGKLR